MLNRLKCIESDLIWKKNRFYYKYDFFSGIILDQATKDLVCLH
jgi:hypothetical protein